MSSSIASTNESSDAEQQSRRRFHWALAGGFTVLFCPFISWWLALRRPSGPPAPEGSRIPATPWRKRLFRLAIVDTLLFICLVTIGVRAPSSRRQQRADAGARIGIQLDPSPPSGDLAGVKIMQVSPGSPADQAGLRVADRILRMDGRPVVDVEAFRHDIGATAPATSRTLHVKRGAAELDVSVAPVVGLRVRPAAPQPLWTPASPEPASAPRTRAIRENHIGYLIVLLLFGVLAILARVRRVQVRVAVQAMMALAMPLPVALLADFLLRRRFAPSLGVELVTQLLATLTMLLMAWLFWRRRKPHSQNRAHEPLDPPGAMSHRDDTAGTSMGAPLQASTAFAWGLLYIYAGGLRVAALIGLLNSVLHLPLNSAAEAFGVSSAWGGPGILLFVLMGVVLAPLAEELLFRGLILPWLASWMQPTAALAWSAAVFGVGHLFYGVGALLPVYYGLVLGWARLRTGHLRAGMALHVLINAVATLAALYLQPFA